MKTIDKLLSFAILIIASGSLLSCAGEEDALKPTKDTNEFAANYKLDPEMASICDDFYDRHRVYLLYNDTLDSYKDSRGVECFHTVNLNWNLTTLNTTDYDFGYLDNNADRKEGARFVEDYLLPSIKGKKKEPYSFLICKSIKEFVSNFNTAEWQDRSNVVSFRCMAFAVGEILKMSDEEKNEALKTLLYEMLNNELMSASGPDIDEFNALVNGVHYTNIRNVIPDWDGSLEPLYELGFLGTNVYGYNFPTNKEDISEFVKNAIMIPREEFHAQWSQYPIIIQRYDIIWNHINDTYLNMDTLK